MTEELFKVLYKTAGAEWTAAAATRMFAHLEEVFF